MGYWRSSSEVLVSEIVGPGPNAIHGPESFTPDYDFQEARIADLYIQSGRKVTYLGDWHTHPDGQLYLSPKDCTTLRRIAASPTSRAPTPLMAVLAGGCPWKLGAWQGRLERRFFRERLLLTSASLRIIAS